ncbi:uncharacterized protein LOC134832183 [Culicoides brevitarsis]|uniref:uncharacterized protein LOC134832183 n=1 Tax=Culicoides brevitarsis TaxID=469753 RepID=UPI00307C057C
MPGWKRPENVAFPSVWLKFKAKDVNSDNLVEYRVQDMTEEDFEKGASRMKEFFVRDEVMNQSMDLANDEKGVQELYQIWKGMVKQRLSLACFKENSEEMVGCNILYISEKDVEDDQELTSTKFKAVARAIDFAISKGPNVKEIYNVEYHLGAFGLSVDPKYRGRGIATEILKARVPLCKALGIELTSNVFTGEASQAVAKKAGFEVNFSMTYDELAHYGFVFDKPVKAKSLAVMSLKIQ